MSKSIKLGVATLALCVAPVAMDGSSPLPHYSQAMAQANGNTNAENSGQYGWGRSPDNFTCPSGWSCSRNQPQAEPEKRKSRFSRSGRTDRGGSSGGGRDGGRDGGND